MATFNLVDRPFLPCWMEGRLQFLSLRDALIRAATVTELRDASPLVTAALIRFLIVVLHRIVVGPKSDKAWKSLWDANAFSVENIDVYLNRHHDRFDLFDAKHPFFQVPFDESINEFGVHKLAIERSQTHCKKHFSHTEPDSRPLMASDEAARQLIAHQCFALAGGPGYYSSKTAGVIISFVQGQNLFETLCLNLLRYPHANSFPHTDNDKPIWERSLPISPDDEIPGGYTDYLTWTYRTIHLIAESDELVRTVKYTRGRKFGLTDDVGFRDPMVCFVSPKDASKADQSLRFSEEKSLWRDLGALLTFTDATIKPSKTLIHLRQLLKQEFISPRHSISFTSIGFATNRDAKAILQFWRHETLPLPLDYLSDPEIVGDLKRAIGVAEKVGLQLKSAIETVAKLILTGGVHKNCDDKRKKAMVASIGADALYWSRLERPFRELLVRLPGELTHRQQQIREWLGELKREAIRAYSEAAKLPQLDARGQRAVIEGEAQLYRGLAKIENSSPDLKPTGAEVTT